MKLRMSPNEKVLFEVAIDQYDEKKRAWISRTFFIVNEGDHLFICDNSGGPLRVKNFNLRRRLSYKKPVKRMVRSEQMRTVKRKGRRYEGLAIDLRDEKWDVADEGGSG